MTIKAVTNAKQVGAYVREAGSRISPEVERAMEYTANTMIRRARKLSSGTVSYTVMRRMDHPYAKRHGAPLLNPAIVNRHRGKFRAGWKKRVFTSPGRKGGQGVTVKLWNDSDVAGFMRSGPKSKMVHRPIIRQIIQDTMPHHRAEIRAAMKRALAGKAVRGAAGRTAVGARSGFASGVRSGFAATRGL